MMLIKQPTLIAYLEPDIVVAEEKSTTLPVVVSPILLYIMTSL
jgi:hypothetical protein